MLRRFQTAQPVAAHRLSFWKDGSGVFTVHCSLFIIHYHHSLFIIPFYILHSTFYCFLRLLCGKIKIRMIRVIRVLLSGYKPFHYQAATSRFHYQAAPSRFHSAFHKQKNTRSFDPGVYQLELIAYLTITSFCLVHGR
jgi:hypothetical protein